MATTSSNRLVINLGSQSNDGTGDPIRDAFSKVNTNFETIFNVAGIGSGLLFTKLADAPKLLTANKVLVTDPTGLTLTQVTAVGAHGIQVTVDQLNKRLLIDSTVTNLVRDPTPTLGGNLSGAFSYRGTEFQDPLDDQDLATKKWIYDNFLNRDAEYEYTSSTNPITGEGISTTVADGSTLRHNVKLTPTGVNTSTSLTNPGGTPKYISVLDAAGDLSEIDITKLGYLPEHITRKDYVDTKISLQGTNTIDPFTGQINSGFGKMTGPLELYRDPIETDDPNTAATKNYVDINSPLSRQNFYVSLDGEDSNYAIPAYKRGRSLAFAFKSVNRAARAAIAAQKASEISLGVYERYITTNNKTELVRITDVGASALPNAVKLTVTYAGGAGTDPWIERSIRPGQYLQGVSNNAVAQILNLAPQLGSNVEEFYEVEYVDYAKTFVSAITPSDIGPGLVTFRL
jgi:hypothetical protein